MGNPLPDWADQETVADADINDIARAMERDPDLDFQTAYDQARHYDDVEEPDYSL